MRAAVEEQLNLIAHGKADFNAVLEHTLNTFTAKFKYFVEHIQGMDELFEVSFSPLASSGRPLSRYMRLLYFLVVSFYSAQSVTLQYCIKRMSCSLLSIDTQV